MYFECGAKQLRKTQPREPRTKPHPFRAFLNRSRLLVTSSLSGSPISDAAVRDISATHAGAGVALLDALRNFGT